jgi:hypothetical protein
MRFKATNAGSNGRQVQSDQGVTNDIRANPYGFMSVNKSVEKDTIAYGSRMWIRMHDIWVLQEGHGVVRMLLIGCTIWLTDGDVGLLRGWIVTS